MSGLNSRTASGLKTISGTNLVAPYVSGDITSLGGKSNLTNFGVAEFHAVANENGPIELNDLQVEAPLHDERTKGVAKLSLLYDSSLHMNPQGQLGVDPGAVTVQAPIVNETAGLGLAIDPGKLAVIDNKLTLTTQLTSIGALPTETATFDAPFKSTIDTDHSNTIIDLAYDSTLEVTSGGQLAVSDAFQNHVAQAIHDGPVVYDAPLKREADTDESKQDHIVLELGKGVELDSDGKLKTNVSDSIQCLGALSDGGLADLGLDEIISYGASSLADLQSGIPDTTVTFLRLKTTQDFTQKSGKLIVKSQGSGRIPYFGALDGLNSRDSLSFNDTLSTLSVPHVSLQSSFSPKDNEAPTAAYTNQLYQAGDAINVSALENGRRLVSVRTDASLAIDDNKNLSVNPSPIVNGSSIRVVDGKIASGLIFSKANGLQLRDTTNNDVQLALEVEGALEMTELNHIKEVLTASKGVKRTENDLSLDLQVEDNSGALSITENNLSFDATKIKPDITSANTQLLVETDGTKVTLTGNIEAKDGSALSVSDNIIDVKVDASSIAVSNGQLVGMEYLFGDGLDADIDQSNMKTTLTLDLKGDDHITINKNTISTDLKPYSAGKNITISNNQISAADPPQQKTYTAGPGLSMIGDEFINSMNITGGVGIIVVGSAETGYTISSESLKSKRRDDEDEKKNDDTDETLKDISPPEVVEATGVITSIVPPPLIPLPPILPPPPVIVPPAVIPFPTLLGGLAATGGLFGTLFGYERERRKNSDGTYALDSDGNYIWDPTDGTNAAIVSDKVSRKTRILLDDFPEDIRVSYGLSVPNVNKLWEFENEITRPWTVDTVSQLISPISQSISDITQNVQNLGSSKQNNLSVTSGLLLNNSALSVDTTIIATKSSLDAVVTRIGTAESNITALGSSKQNSLSVASGLLLNNSALSVDTTIIATKATVDAAVTRIGTAETNITALGSNKQDKVTAGTGLTLSGTTLSVSPSQSQITLVGTLTGLSVSGTVNVQSTLDSTSTASGALQVAGGVGIAKSLFVGGSNFTVGGVGLLKTATSISDYSVIGTNVADGTTNTRIVVSGNTRSGYAGWIDYIATATGGHRWSTIGGSLQPLVLDTNGILSLSTLTDSTSTTTGALQIAGGAVVNKTLYATSIVLGEGNSSLKLRSGTSWTKADYTISYRNSSDSLHVHLAGADDSAAPRHYQFGYYTSDTYGTWNGKVSIDSYYGTTYLYATSDSTSATTGVLQVSGGVGIAKSLFVGGSVSGPTISAINGTLTSQSTSITNLQNSKQNTLSTTAGITLANNVVGYDNTVIASKSSVDTLAANVASTYQPLLTAGTGLSLSGNTLSVNPIQSQITAVGTLTGLSVSGNFNVQSTLDSTSTASGALQVAGGVGIAKSLFVGGTNFTVAGIGLMKTATSISDYSVIGTNVADGVTNTRIVVSGNTRSGYAGAIDYVATATGGHKWYTIGGNLLPLTLDSSGILSLSTLTDSTSATTGALQVSGGVGIAKSLFVGNTNDSTSATTGAVQVSGGVGIAKSLFVGNTNDSTSAITGAAQVSGGVGIAKSLFVGSSSDYLANSSTSALTVTGSIRTLKSISLGLSANLSAIPVYTASGALDGGFLSSYCDSTNLMGDGNWNRYLDIACFGASNGSVGGGVLRFLTNPNNSTSVVERMRIKNDGTVWMLSTTDSTSLSTGTLQVSGGVGIAKSLFVGNTINSLSTITGDIKASESFSGNETVLVYPPTGNQILTQDGSTTLATLPYSNGTYIINASTELSGFPAYKGFQDKPNVTPWSSGGQLYDINSGFYSGSVTTTDAITGNQVLGEWIEVKLPQRKYITSVTVYSRPGFGRNGPTGLVVMGSSTSNGAYNVIGSFGPTTWNDNVGQSFTLTTPGTYLWLRLVVTSTDHDTSYGGYCQITFSFKGSSPFVNVVNTTDSTSPYNGSLIVAGGAGISKQLTVGGAVVGGALTSLSTNYSAVNLYTSSLRVYAATQPGNGVGDFYIYDGTNSRTLLGYFASRNTIHTAAAAVQIDSTTDSLNPTNGALQVAGGLGVQKSVTVGGAVLQRSPNFFNLIQTTAQSFTAGTQATLLFQNPYTFATGASATSTTAHIVQSGWYRFCVNVTFTATQQAFQSATNIISLNLGGVTNPQQQTFQIAMGTSTTPSQCTYTVCGTFYAFANANTDVRVYLTASQPLTTVAAPSGNAYYGSTNFAGELVCCPYI